METKPLTEPLLGIDDYRALASRLDQVGDELATMRITSRSADGCVTATVGAAGDLMDIHIDPDVAAGLDFSVIARRIVEAASIAAAEAFDRRSRAISELLPDRMRPIVGALARDGRS